MVILAMGKLGGREINYHSDLDIVFLYEADGHTAPAGRKSERTSNQHFFSELAGRIIKTTAYPGAYGRLYEIDARLRPTGKSGTLATSMHEFKRYFAEGHGQLWERLALCRARAAIGSPRAIAEVTAAVETAAFDHPRLPEHAEEIRRMRHRLQETADSRDVKRGPGGIVDIEFLVQMLQLKHGRKHPEVRQPNTLRALESLHKAGYLSADEYGFFDHNYRLLRTIEGHLRLTNATARDTLPKDPTELTKLAHLLRYTDPDALLDDFENATQQIRQRFNKMIATAGK
jgi:glutamate-ammonia-ligase adenylyltransferase